MNHCWWLTPFHCAKSKSNKDHLQNFSPQRQILGHFCESLLAAVNQSAEAWTLNRADIGLAFRNGGKNWKPHHQETPNTSVFVTNSSRHFWPKSHVLAFALFLFERSGAFPSNARRWLQRRVASQVCFQRIIEFSMHYTGNPCTQYIFVTFTM